MGPVYGRDPAPEELLARAYRSCLELAMAKGLRSIAFPSTSTGGYGFPIERAAEVALENVVRARTRAQARGLEEVRFVLFSSGDYDVYSRALAGR